MRYIFMLGCITMYLLFTNEIQEAASDAVSICSKTLIPTLFPSILLGSVISSTSIPEQLAKRIHFLTNKLFGLSGICFDGIITGLLLGYNSSYINSVTLYNEGRITLNEAQRLAMIFNGPGIAFCISVAGIKIYNNTKIGIIFLIASIVSSLISGAIVNLINRKSNDLILFNRISSFSDTVIKSGKDSALILLNICSFVILFLCLKALILKLLPFELIIRLTEITGEVVSGLSFCTNFKSVFPASFCIFFGGFCIFFQQLPFLKQLRINLFQALGYKIITAFLSSVITLTIIKFMPLETAVFYYNLKPSVNNSAFSSFSLIALLVINIYFYFSEKTKFRLKNN